MKIADSTVLMNSTHVGTKTSMIAVETKLVNNDTEKNSLTKEEDSDKGMLEISERAKELLKEYTEKQQTSTSSEPDKLRNISSVDPMNPNYKLEFKRQLIEQMKEMLKHLRDGNWIKGANGVLKLKSPLSISQNLNAQDTSLRVQNRSTTWQREVKVSSFYAEQETTTFSSQGVVHTSDGREISFNVDLEMSRSFVQNTEAISKDTVQIMTDPLVINVNSNFASVSDQKFLFDLDADGEKEEISSLGSGSGFLALDKNNDGQINDGNELFGTKSGDGFGDLASYDSDHNGWIDENDSVYEKLKVWMKNEDGKDVLLSLKSADVGAIYLDNVSTQFELNQAETNETNAAVRQTGVYLKESGGAGTVQHVDFAI